MSVGWLSLLAAFLILIHHYQKHGRFFDKEDLMTLKFRSHEFWIVLFTVLGLLMLGLDTPIVE